MARSFPVSRIGGADRPARDSGKRPAGRRKHARFNRVAQDPTLVQHFHQRSNQRRSWIITPVLRRISVESVSLASLR